MLGVRAQGAYESADTTSRRVSKWRAPTVSPNDAILANLATIRDRSRAAIRNDGLAEGAIDAQVRNLIGTGIKPLSQAKDPAFREAVHKLFTRWTDESDADGLLDFYGQESLVARGWLEGGEKFVRLRFRRPGDMRTVPLQLQLLEPELCPHTYDRLLPSGNRVRAGIEFDGIGRRVAFWFHPTRPGDPQDFDPSILRRIPADQVIHVYLPLRAGQLRGLPLHTQSLIKLLEVGKFDDAVTLRQQIANLFVGSITKTGSALAAPMNPLTGEEITSTTERPLAEMVPGIIQELDPGDELKFNQPPDAGNTYADFMRQQLYGIAAAAKVPYEILTGDLSRVNDRTVRVILHEFRRRVQAWQHQIIAFQFCRRVYQAWMDQAFLSGALALPATYADDPEPWVAVKWMPQAWPYLHPVQDVQAATNEIRAGLTSRSAAIAERGEDAEVVDAEQAADNKRAEELGLVHDSNAKYTSSAGVTQARPAGSEVVDATEDTLKAGAAA